MASTELIESVEIPANMRKMTTLAAARFYDKIEIYANRAIGYIKGMQSQTWFFKDFNGIEVIHANMNSQFAQVVFQTAVNAKSKFVDLDFGAMQNRNAMHCDMAKKMNSISAVMWVLPECYLCLNYWS